jgi:hypothetical protein
VGQTTALAHLVGVKIYRGLRSSKVVIAVVQNASPLSLKNKSELRKTQAFRRS